MCTTPNCALDTRKRLRHVLHFGSAMCLCQVEGRKGGGGKSEACASS
jgi:hypothetical protein